jgi:hypothetical protein
MKILRSLFLLALVSVLPCCSSGSEKLECVVAKRMDEPCPIPVAASAAELAAQPCLQHWDRAADVKACPAAQENELKSCPENFVKGNWTRIAAQSGSSCVFEDECQTDGDCVAAANKATCCSCDAWVPRQLLVNDPCYVTSGQTPSSACKLCVELGECVNSCSSVSGHCVNNGTGYRKCLAD